MLSFLIQIAKGILIGAGAILPGISSGVLCVIFGIYEKLLNAILGFFSNIKENTKFLFPILLGIGCGSILFSNLLNYLFLHFKIPAYFSFIGLILGSIPSIIKQAHIKHIRLSYIICLLLTLSFSFYLVAMEHYNTSYLLISHSFASFILAGFAMSAGVVIPGVSSTVILMLFGKYEIYLSAMATLNFHILLPMGIGLVLGAIILLLLIRFFFTYFKHITYFAILGFVLGSIPVLLPNVSTLSDMITGIFCLLLGLGIAWGISQLDDKKKKE